jgi:hypothetical protein
MKCERRKFTTNHNHTSLLLLESCLLCFLFIVCDLFSNADSISDYILPKEKIELLVINNKMKGKWTEASNLL